MALQAKKLGTKKGIEKSLKGGGDQYAMRTTEEGTVIRFLTEPEEWWEVDLHFDQERKTSYPCIGLEDGCIGCEEGLDKSKRWFAAAYNVEDDRVGVFEMPKTLVKALYKKYERYNTLTDHTFEFTKEGKGLQTTYEVEVLGKERIKGQEKMKAPDLHNFLEEMLKRAMREIDGVEETVTSKGRSKSSARSRRRELVDDDEIIDDEDIDDDDDLDDEEEEEDERPVVRRRKPTKKTRPSASARGAKSDAPKRRRKSL